MIRSRNVDSASGVNKFYIEFEQPERPLQILNFTNARLDTTTMADTDIWRLVDFNGQVVEAGAWIDAITGALNSGSITVNFYNGTTTVPLLSATMSFASASTARLFVTGSLVSSTGTASDRHVSAGTAILMRADLTATVATTFLVGKVAIETLVQDFDKIYHIPRNGRVVEIAYGGTTAVGANESGSVTLGIYRLNTASVSTTMLLTSATLSLSSGGTTLRPITATLATTSARARPGLLGGMQVSASTVILVRVDSTGPVSLDGLSGYIEIEWDD